jgi:hypothetical protein
MDTTFFASSSKLVYSGKIPYKDFFLSQFPIAPYIYGFFQQFIGFNLFTLSGINAFFGLLTMILCLIMAYKGSGYFGALSFGLFYAFNSFNNYNYSIGKMYAIVAFFLVAGVFFFSLKTRPLAMHTLGMCMIAISLSCRMTVLPFYVIMCCYLIIAKWKNKKAWLLPISISTLFFALLFLPFVLNAKDLIYHDIFGIHVGQGKGPFEFGLMNRLMALFQTFRYYFIPVILIPLLFVPIRITEGKQAKQPINDPLFLTFLWIALVLTMLGHFTINWFTPAYQSMIFPIFALLLGIRTGRLIENITREDLRRIALVFIISCSILLTVSYGKESIWYHLGKSGYSYLHELNKYLVENTKPEDKILAFSSLVNVNANRDFAPGTETFPFTFTPSWVTEKCRKFNTVNVEILTDYFKSGEIKALVLDENSFDIQFPAFTTTNNEDKLKIWKSIQENYFNFRTIPQFGSEFKDLYIFLHKSKFKNH